MIFTRIYLTIGLIPDIHEMIVMLEMNHTRNTLKRRQTSRTCSSVVETNIYTREILNSIITQLKVLINNRYLESFTRGEKATTSEFNRNHVSRQSEQDKHMLPCPLN